MNHPTLAPYGSYCCADGIDIIFSVQNDREWVSFCAKFLNRPELTREHGFADNMQRLVNRNQLDEIINAHFARLTSAEAMHGLEAAGLAYGRLNQIDDVSRHPHLRRVPISTPAGEIEVIAPAAIFDGDHRPELRPVPAKGEQTSALRDEFAPLSVTTKF